MSEDREERQKSLDVNTESNNLRVLSVAYERQRVNDLQTLLNDGYIDKEAFDSATFDVGAIKADLLKLTSAGSLDRIRKNPEMISYSRSQLLGESYGRSLFVESSDLIYPELKNKIHPTNFHNDAVSFLRFLESNTKKSRKEVDEIVESHNQKVVIENFTRIFVRVDQNFSNIEGKADLIIEDLEKLIENSVDCYGFVREEDKNYDVFLEEINKFIYILEVMKEQVLEAKEGKYAKQREADLGDKQSSHKKMDAREAKELQDELLLQLVEDNSGISLLTSFPASYQKTLHINGAGFQPVFSANKIVQDKYQEMRDLGVFSGSVTADMVRMGMDPQEQLRSSKYFNDIFSIEMVKEDVVQTVEKSRSANGIKGFLGGTEKYQVHEKVGERPVLHSNLVRDGKRESGYRLSYHVRDKAIDKRQGNEDAYAYLDYSHRGGNMLSVSAVLPESIVKMLLPRIKEDPGFVRRVVERLALKTGIKEEDWSDGKNCNGFPMKPPYEKLARAHDGKDQMFVNVNINGKQEMSGIFDIK